MRLIKNRKVFDIIKCSENNDFIEFIISGIIKILLFIKNNNNKNQFKL